MWARKTQDMLARLPKTAIVNTSEPSSCASCWDDEGQEQRVIGLEVANVDLAVGTMPESSAIRRRAASPATCRRPC